MARTRVTSLDRELVKNQDTKLVIGIDPGTNCGYALLKVRKGKVALVSSGVWDLSREKHEGGGMQMVRLEQNFFAFVDRNGKFQNVYLAFELNRFVAERQKGGKRIRVGPDAQQFYGGVKNLIMKMCEERHIPYMGIAPSTIKKQVTGKGNSGKEMVKRTLQDCFSKSFDGKLDETDAVACGLAFIRLQGWHE